MAEFYNQEEDNTPVKSEHTWADAHALGQRMTKMTKSGVSRFSNNMGHGAECPTCSKGILEDQEADLGVR